MSAKNIDGSQYWDGGFLTKIPAETLVEKERPDRLIIHYLPMREEATRLLERDWSAIALMERALGIARKEIERHRLNALGEMNGRILWVTPDVPPVSPSDLSAGKKAVEAAYAHAKSALGFLRHR
jgi:hypothetical protein